MSQNQIHSNFKLFRGTNFLDMCETAEQYIKTSGVAAVSIGVEFLEKTSEYVLSIGYNNEEAFEVSIFTVLLGTESLDLETIESNMNRAVIRLEDSGFSAICHEIYVDDEGFSMVVLTKRVSGT
jgi:hypothetical protein